MYVCLYVLAYFVCFVHMEVVKKQQHCMLYILLNIVNVKLYNKRELFAKDTVENSVSAYVFYIVRIA